jgi:hypothetical protein
MNTDDTTVRQVYETAAARETHRIKKILGCRAAATRPKFANYMAFKTNVSADDAITMIELAGIETRTPGVTANPAQAAALWDGVIAKVNSQSSVH